MRPQITVTSLPYMYIVQHPGIQSSTTQAIQKKQGQSNLSTGRIAAAHGQFSGIRHVAPVCSRI